MTTTPTHDLYVGAAPIYHPTEQTPGQMVGAWSTALGAAAAELGAVFDAFLKDRIGPDWRPALENVRAERERKPNYSINVRDPQWVFSEAKKPNSPLHPAMRPGWSRSFGDVIECRNDWYHYNHQWTLDELVNSIEALYRATRLWPELRVNDAVKALHVHLGRLREQRVLPGPREKELRNLLADQARRAEETQAELGGQLDSLRRIVAEQAGNAELQDLLRGQIAENEERARVAEEQSRMLERRLAELEREAANQADPDSLLPITIRPGDKWPDDVPHGRRVMKLMARPVDQIFDPAKGDFITSELGDVARAAATRWHEVMPLGGEIHVTDGWNSAGRVNGVWTYLGRLDDPGEQDRTLGAAISDFLVPRSYALLTSEVVDLRSDVRLTDVRPETAELTIERLESAVADARARQLLEREEITDGEEDSTGLRITVNGHVVATFGEDRGYLATVTPDEWFPGHLRE